MGNTPPRQPMNTLAQLCFLRPFSRILSVAFTQKYLLFPRVPPDAPPQTHHAHRTYCRAASPHQIRDDIHHIKRTRPKIKLPHHPLQYLHQQPPHRSKEKRPPWRRPSPELRRQGNPKRTAHDTIHYPVDNFIHFPPR